MRRRTAAGCRPGPRYYPPLEELIMDLTSLLIALATIIVEQGIG